MEVIVSLYVAEEVGDIVEKEDGIELKASAVAEFDYGSGIVQIIPTNKCRKKD